MARTLPTSAAVKSDMMAMLQAMQAQVAALQAAAPQPTPVVAAPAVVVAKPNRKQAQAAQANPVATVVRRDKPAAVSAEKPVTFQFNAYEFNGKSYVQFKQTGKSQAPSYQTYEQLAAHILTIRDQADALLAAAREAFGG